MCEDAIRRMIAPKAAAAYDNGINDDRPLGAITFKHTALGKDQDR
jgi:hypothetical protein